MLVVSALAPLCLTEAQASTTGESHATVISFVTDVVKAMKGQKDYCDRTIDYSFNSDGSVTIFPGEEEPIMVTAETVDSYRSCGNLSLKEAQYMAVAIKLRLLKANTYKDMKSALTYRRAYIILAHADEWLYGFEHEAVVQDGYKDIGTFVTDDPNNPHGYWSYERTPNYVTKMVPDISDETLKFVQEKRLSNIDKIQNAKAKEYITKAYMMGFVKGERDTRLLPDGTTTTDYTDTRHIRFNVKPGSQTVSKLVSMLTNKSERYVLTREYKMCRTSKKGMPKSADFYDYILDTYPNAYYDFPYRSYYIYPEYREVVCSSTEHKAEVYMEALTREIPEGGNRYVRDRSPQLIFPYEIDEFFSMMGKNIRESYDACEAFPDRIVEYLTLMLNVDYRTLEKDKHWRERMLYLIPSNSDADIDRYIEEIKRTKTIIKCDVVALDKETLARDATGITYKVYTHFCVVSDTGLEKGDDNTGTRMVYNFGEYGADMTGHRDRHPLVKRGIKPGEWVDWFWAINGETYIADMSKLGFVYSYIAQDIESAGKKDQLGTIKLDR